MEFFKGCAENPEALDQGKWRKVVYKGKNIVENEKLRHNKLKRDIRERHINEEADEMESDCFISVYFISFFILVRGSLVNQSAL